MQVALLALIFFVHKCFRVFLVFLSLLAEYFLNRCVPLLLLVLVLTYSFPLRVQRRTESAYHHGLRRQF